MNYRYVDIINGDDTNGDGSAGNPYKTIGKASLDLTGGDEIRVAKSPDNITLPGTLSWVDGSFTIETSQDLTSILSPGDFIGKGTDWEEGWWEISSITSSEITLAKKYYGSTETLENCEKLGVIEWTSNTNSLELNVDVGHHGGTSENSRLIVSGGWDLQSETKNGITAIKRASLDRQYNGIYIYAKYIEITNFIFVGFNAGISIKQLYSRDGQKIVHCAVIGNTYGLETSYSTGNTEVDDLLVYGNYSKGIKDTFARFTNVRVISNYTGIYWLGGSYNNLYIIGNENKAVEGRSNVSLTNVISRDNGISISFHSSYGFCPSIILNNYSSLRDGTALWFGGVGDCYLKDINIDSSSTGSRFDGGLKIFVNNIIFNNCDKAIYKNGVGDLYFYDAHLLNNNTDITFYGNWLYYQGNIYFEKELGIEKNDRNVQLYGIIDRESTSPEIIKLTPCFPFDSFELAPNLILPMKFDVESGNDLNIVLTLKKSPSFDGEVRFLSTFHGEILSFETITPTDNYEDYQISISGSQISQDGVVEGFLKVGGTSGDIFLSRVVVNGNQIFPSSLSWYMGSPNIIYTRTQVDYPNESDVRQGVSYDNGNKTGTLDLPAEADVRDGVKFDNETKEGTLDLPVEQDVRKDTKYDNNNKTGTLDLPLEKDVREGISYDNNSKTGNLKLPSENDVEENIAFGADGNEFTGKLKIPSQEDVRKDVGYGADGNEFTGLLDLPSEDDVEEGVQYDNETKEGNLKLPDETEVKDGVGYGANGTEFTGSLQTAAQILDTNISVEDDDPTINVEVE